MTKTKRRRSAGKSPARRILVLHGPNLNLLGIAGTRDLRQGNTGRYRPSTGASGAGVWGHAGMLSEQPRRGTDRAGARCEGSGVCLHRHQSCRVYPHQRGPQGCPCSSTDSVSSRYTCPTFTPGSLSGITRTSRTSQSGRSAALAAVVTISPCSSRCNPTDFASALRPTRTRSLGGHAWICENSRS